MAQGEHVKGHDVCRVEKFEGPPGNLRKVGESESSSENSFLRTSILRQPKFDDTKPSFQGKITI